MEKFNSSLMGDPQREEILEQTEFAMGDFDSVDFDENDIADMYAGAPAADTVARLISKSSRQSVPTALKIPGVAMGMAKIPAMFVFNATIVQYGAERSLPGTLVKQNLEKHVTATPGLTQTKSVNGSGSGTPVSVIFANADLPAGFSQWTVPLIFINFTAPTLNARAGENFEVKLTASNEFGAAIESVTWIIKRQDATKEIKLWMIPFTRQKDYLVPTLVSWGLAAATLTVTVENGMTANDTMQVYCPGLDSQEMKQFSKTFNAGL